jgi:hypothetical protein
MIRSASCSAPLELCEAANEGRLLLEQANNEAVAAPLNIESKNDFRRIWFEDQVYTP